MDGLIWDLDEAARQAGSDAECDKRDAETRVEDEPLDGLRTAIRDTWTEAADIARQRREFWESRMPPPLDPAHTYANAAATEAGRLSRRGNAPLIHTLTDTGENNVIHMANASRSRQPADV